MLHNQRSNRKWHDTPYPDIDFSSLWRNQYGGCHALLKLAPGACLPAHRHPGWEQIFLLEGKLKINCAILEAGDHVLLPAGEVHQVEALASSIYLVMSEKEGAELLMPELQEAATV